MCMCNRVSIKPPKDSSRIFQRVDYLRILRGSSESFPEPSHCEPLHPLPLAGQEDWEPGSAALAQLVECSPSKHKSPGFHPQHCTAWAMAVHSCNPSPLGVEAGWKIFKVMLNYLRNSRPAQDTEALSQTNKNRK